MVQHLVLQEQLLERLPALKLHEEILEDAQACLLTHEREHAGPREEANPFETVSSPSATPDVEWGADCYIASFMTRAGAARTLGVLAGGISFQWKSGGVDSSQCWRSAVASLEPCGDTCDRRTFHVMDVFEAIKPMLCVDAQVVANDGELRSGRYLNLPFPDARASYRFRSKAHTHPAALPRSRTHSKTLRQRRGWTITRPLGQLQLNELTIINGPTSAAVTIEIPEQKRGRPGPAPGPTTAEIRTTLKPHGSAVAGQDRAGWRCALATPSRQIM